MLEKLSIIIPIAADEQNHLPLVESLEEMCPEAEIIISQEAGRAESLNAGIEKATGDFLWFVHADSQVSLGNLRALSAALSDSPNALHYFKLAYDTPTLWMKFTAWGANFRSQVLGCPFGDQGFCIRRAHIQQVGLFNTSVAYGEDHLFVWQCRAAHIPLSCIQIPLVTSARKYQQQGWFKTTLKHQYLWIKQVIPLWLKTEYHLAR